MAQCENCCDNPAITGKQYCEVCGIEEELRELRDSLATEYVGEDEDELAAWKARTYERICALEHQLSDIEEEEEMDDEIARYHP
jgi:hypothetical protein